VKELHEKLFSIGRKKTIEKDAFLFHRGDPAKGFYYITRGQIRLYKLDLEGRELEIARLSCNDFLGEVVLFAGGDYPVSAQSIKKSEVLFFRKDMVLELIKKDPFLSEFFLKLLARKCISLSDKLESLFLKTVKQRLINYLLQQCPGDGSCEIKLKVKKTDLAKSIGTISATLSRNLKQLEDEKLVKINGNKVQVLNCPALKSAIF
jgi:CRP/FNR family transcriptional regulator, dissimilatory nitrate respiration regulator